MKWIRTTFLAVALIVGGVAVTKFTYFWTATGAAISRAEQSGILDVSFKDEPLTLVERTIVAAEFGLTWNIRRFPCRPVAGLWQDELQRRAVSGALARMLYDKSDPAGSLSWHMTQLMVVCRLESYHSDTQMLRAWLARANFGYQLAGLESVTKALFGKAPDGLDAAESVRLAALLRAPSVRNNPARWDELARSIRDRIASADPPSW